MSTLKKILGSTIQVLDDDPIEYVGSWSTGGNLNQTAYRGAMSAGTSTAGAVAGGFSPGNYYDYFEQYNGTSWTETTEINTARSSGGSSGTSTAMLIFGGRISSPSATNVTESWNGSTWTEVSDMNYPRYSPAISGQGSQTAAIDGGGNNRQSGSSDNITNVETWDGSSWSETTDLPSVNGNAFSFGSSTALILAGGYPLRTTSLSWNGSSWTSSTSIPVSKSGGPAGAGTTTSGLIWGGWNGNDPGLLAGTQAWDGSAWTEVNDLSTARQINGGPKGPSTGSSSSAISFGGTTSPSGPGQYTEEWSFPSPTATVRQEGQLYFKGGLLKGFEKAGGIPAATYSAGGNLNTARGYMGGAGLQTAGLIFGGNTGSVTAITENYNGSSWTEVSDLNTGRTNNAGFGTSTAAISSGGSNPPNNRDEVESWNGSSWTETSELNTERSDSAGSGSQTSGMIATGTTPSPNPASRPGGTTIVTETWDGSSWTEVADTNTQRLQAGMSVNGPTSNSIIAGGENGPGSQTADAETWNGTSWTEVNNLNTARATLYNFAGTGSQAVAAGGYAGTTRTAISEIWNGTSWTEGNDLSTARNAGYGFGFGTASIHCGGDTPPYTNATEELSADITNTTVTTS